MVTRRARMGLVSIMLAFSLVGVMSGALAGSGSATIIGGHPAAWLDGATELAFLSSCKGLATVPANLQGIDGYVIDVSGNNRFSVRGTPNDGGTPVFSMNARFYSGPRCDYMSVPSRALVGTSYGPIDITGARYAVISLSYGANIKITWDAYTV